MFINFTAALSEQLIVNRFEPVKQLSSMEITEETKIMGFINTYNAAWYAVVLINTRAVG